MKILCMNGPPESGKDTFARFLSEELRLQGKQYLIHKLSLAQDLKIMSSLICDYLQGMSLKHELPWNPTGNWFDRKHKDKKIGEFNITPRAITIALSEDLFIRYCGDRFWINQAIKTIEDNHMSGYKNIFIITDLGFQKEIDALEEIFPKQVEVYQLFREGKDFKNDSRGFVSHPIIHRIWNDDGLSELKGMARLHASRY